MNVSRLDAGCQHGSVKLHRVLMFHSILELYDGQLFSKESNGISVPKNFSLLSGWKGKF